MRAQAGVNAALAAALCGMLPTLLKANTILFSLTLASIIILLLSALVLILHDKSSSKIWQWLVKRASSVEVGYASAGLGLASTGISLIFPFSSWTWLGLPIFLLGGFFIGSQIGKGINIAIFSKKAVRKDAPVVNEDKSINNKSENNMTKVMKKIVAEFADGTLRGIQLYFATRLEKLTKAIIWLTLVLLLLAIVQIILLVRN